MERAKRQLEELKQWLLRFTPVRIVWMAVEAYYRHDCIFMVSALSFFAIISLIPLAVLCFWGLTVLVGSSETAQHYLAGLLNNYLLPATTEVVIERAQALAGSSIAGFLGVWWSLLVFVWSGAKFFDLIQVTLSRAWGGNNVRPFWKRKLFTVIAFIMAGVLGVLAVALSTALTAFRLKGYELFGFSPGTVLLWALHVLPVVFSIMLFVFLYRYMPVVYVPWRVAIGTGVPVGIVWELGKRLFTLLIVDREIYRQVYGTMTGFILLLVWIYFSGALLLMGAEIGAAWQHELRKAREARAAKAAAQPAVAAKAQPEAEVR